MKHPVICIVSGIPRSLNSLGMTRTYMSLRALLRQHFGKLGTWLRTTDRYENPYDALNFRGPP